MRILLTGATGFIGTHVLKHLLALEKYEIITTSELNKENAEKICLQITRTEYIQKDLNDKDKNYYTFFNKPDCVIHLSWEGLPNYNELFHIERNLPNNFYFIKNMIQNGLKDITVAGTCFEYGLQTGCLKEDIPALPVTAYGLAKDTLRKFIELLNKEYKFSMKWIRLFYLYGDGQGKKTLYGQLEEAVINNYKEFNMSMGEQLRDYIHIDDAAANICKITLQNEITGIINCCSGKPISVRKFVEEYFKEKGRDIKLNLGHYPYAEYEPLAFWGDTEKLNITPPV